MAVSSEAFGPEVTTRPAAVIDRVTLVVPRLDRAEDDYVTTFGCRVEQRGRIGPALARVLGVPHAHGRRSLLRLGGERIELLEFACPAGRPYPPGSTSTDLWFQHLALLVDDMTFAYQRILASRGFRPISRNGPVRLPVSSGDVLAFKFRDRDGHPLELLAPAGGPAPGKWRPVHGSGPFLGIDHTAIAVSDTARNEEFFGPVFGFGTGIRTENRGAEQDDLDNEDHVHVSVTRLAPDRPAPRLELLRYHVGTRRPIPAGTVGNDIAATHAVVWIASLDAIAVALGRRPGRMRGAAVRPAARPAGASGPQSRERPGAAAALRGHCGRAGTRRAYSTLSRKASRCRDVIGPQTMRTALSWASISSW